ncbi:hypothetical protein TNCV_4430871 [Trichonephila clavipes]|nr:hypothetical protein TNCV_4430871 [Trichonephila clavipes]
MEWKVLRSNLPSLVTLALQKNCTLQAPQSWHLLSTAKAAKPSDKNGATHNEIDRQMNNSDELSDAGLEYSDDDVDFLT